VSKKEVEQVWKVRRWHFMISFTKQVPEVLSPYGSLCSSISPAAIKDANTAVKQCANLSSEAAVKPRGTYAKFTPEN